MFIRNGIRFNIYAPFESEEGTRYANMTDPYFRVAYQITEVPDPQPPEDFSDTLYYRTEQDTAPFVIYTRKPQEQIDQALGAKAVADIDALERNCLYPRILRTYLLTVLDPASFEYQKIKGIDDQIAELRAVVVSTSPAPPV